MRLDAPALVFLSQTAANELDGLARAPWWAVLILALLGGTAGVAKAWSVVAEYLRDKRELARRTADEEKLRRDAKAKAEIEQIQALTEMARSFPAHSAEVSKSHEAMAREVRDAIAILARGQSEHNKELAEIRREMASDTRALVKAIAGKLGVQNDIDETNSSGVRRLSAPGQEPQAQRA